MIQLILYISVGLGVFDGDESAAVGSAVLVGVLEVLGVVDVELIADAVVDREIFVSV